MSASVDAEDRPKTFFHPPSLMMGAVAVGFAMRLVWGGFMPLPRAVGEGAGIVLALGGVSLLTQSIRFFLEHGETLRPDTPSTALLRAGPFARSRNPIYVAMALIGAGLGFATLNVFILATTAIAVALLHFFVILPEEAYLERRFGAEYVAYKTSVRRWI
ncbi:MAG: hypothetical protein GC152_08105 [Alphaproteobacteria bacterium]|nr:hypothetical protein [Alphaproteobacteria bacterium]